MRLAPPLAILLLASAPGAAWAEDQLMDTSACSTVCQIQRNLFGHAGPGGEPAAIGRDPGLDDGPLTSAGDGADHPDPQRLVRRRGEVMLLSAAERAAIRKQKAAMERKITKPVP